MYQTTKLISFCLICLTISSSVFAQQESPPFKPRAPYQNPTSFKQTLYNTFQSKKLKSATRQRDSIFFELLDRERQIKNLKVALERANEYGDSLSNALTKLSNLYDILSDERNELLAKLEAKDKELKALNSKYKKIIASSLKRNDRLNTIINNKEKELSEREKRLKELSSILRKKDSLLRSIYSFIKKALVDFAGDEIEVNVKDGKVYVTLKNKLLFASGSATVEPKGKIAISQLANFFAKSKNFDILVEGHTDNVPINTARYPDNWSLSADRSVNVVRTILQSNNSINPKRITAAGRAEFSPVASNNSAIGRAKNRRIEIILIPNLKDLFNILSKESKVY